MITKEQAMEILNKFDFFQGQRAGRELWSEKPFDVQEEDIASFARDVAFLKEYIEAVNVSEVVRCKDCKHWCIQEGNDINQSYFCSRDEMWCMPTRKADDFCSYGERK